MSNDNSNPLFGDDDGNSGPVLTAAPTEAGAAPASSTNLMASLLGNGDSGGGGGGLFGDDEGITSNGRGGGGGGLFGDDDDEPPPFATTTAPAPAPSTATPAAAPVPPSAPANAPAAPAEPTAPVPAPAPAPTTTTATTTTTTTTSSLLMQSGLLPGSGGGGLFDEVDQEEQEQAARQQAEAAAAAERARQEQEEKARKQREQEEAAAAQKAQEELQRQQQESFMQQQQQQLTDQMQSVYLGNTIAPSAPQQQSMQQTQPNSYGMAQSMPPSYSNVPSSYGGGLPGQAPQQPHQSPGGQSFNPQQQQTSYGGQPFNPQQQQPVGTQSYMGPAPVQAGFYRDHGMHAGGVQSYMDPSAAAQQQQRYSQPAQQPNPIAGMYNGPPAQQAVLGRPPALPPVKEPPPVPTFYAAVKVSEPLLIPGQALFGNAPHWSYQIATTLHPPPGTTAGNNHSASGGVWLVRRRFRHVVALEDRLREECPGAILPPRPDKHATRALEEASTQQSAEFAVQRANELQVYLNQLIHHPIAYGTHTLRLFLSLQDDLGTAWPEVSNNAFTRLANAGVGAAVKVSEQTQATKFPWQDPMGHIDDYGEVDAELMALASQEQVRMSAVLQAVPKLEGAVTLLREGAELRGATGMELSRLAKEVETSDKELSYPMELVAGGMLRGGRRSKRMALELAAAMETFVQQYKTCRYEKMAFTDRRIAIMRRTKERGKADQRAHQLLMQQQRQMYQQQPYGGPYGGGNVHQMQNQAINADTLALDADQECNEIGRRVKSEVNRIAWQRRQEWKASVKVVASASKEAITENVAIWESVRESFLQAFPEE